MGATVVRADITDRDALMAAVPENLPVVFHVAAVVGLWNGRADLMVRNTRVLCSVHCSLPTDSIVPTCSARATWSTSVWRATCSGWCTRRPSASIKAMFKRSVCVGERVDAQRLIVVAGRRRSSRVYRAHAALRSGPLSSVRVHQDAGRDRSARRHRGRSVGHHCQSGRVRQLLFVFSHDSLNSPTRCDSK